MRILVVTSCTGEKTVESPDGLTQADFATGPEHVAQREQSLPLTLAEDLYAGMQHLRLMQGIRSVRAHPESGWMVDLHIVSAGYGLVPAARPLAPYEVTFTGMKSEDLRDWATRLRIPTDIRALLAEPYDLGLMLLGDHYLQACQLNAAVTLGGPTLLFCGRGPAKKLPVLKSLRVVTLSNPEATRYQCGLVGLKGEVARRILGGVVTDPALPDRLFTTDTDVLGILDRLTEKPVVASAKPSEAAPARIPKLTKTPVKARAHPDVDRVITLPDSWQHKPHRAQLRYFIPEWDDLVDPDYDFATDTHSGGVGDWSNEVYAHQMYPEPNYDGILISRAVAEKSKKKNARINEMGAHRYLRVPREFPIMGDCGAFDYIEEKEPPYTTADVIDYYTRLDFDAGVSVDHLIVPAFYADKQFRYDLTIHNAEDFLREHRQQDLPWQPIGAVQGWDPKSYADAVAAYIKMGYRYLALGGLVRCSTKEITGILQEVQKRLQSGIGLHLFGIARPEALPTFTALGVTSVDSASHLRRAWLNARNNYFTLEGTSYSAIRIPEVGKSFRAKLMVGDGKATEEELQNLQREAMRAVIAVDQGQMPVADAVKVIEAYDRLIGEDRDWMYDEYRRTLEDQPWKHCPCAICQTWGVQVVIFRGNNRNRRRGFHNTYVFYRLMQQALLKGSGSPKPVALPQLELFGTEEAA